MTDYVDAPASRVAQKMTPKIRNLALDAGWPQEAVERLRVTHTTGYLHAEFAGDPKDLEDLEYGTSSSAPRSVVGNFFGSHETRTEIRKASQVSLKEIQARIDRLFA